MGVDFNKAIGWIKSNFAASGGAGLVGFVQSGTGAVARSVQAKLRDYPSLLDYGDAGGGVDDDYEVFATALAANAGGGLYIPKPRVAYKIGTGKLIVPADTDVVGASRKKTRLLHAYNGDMIELLDGASLSNLFLDGQNGAFTGRGVVHLGTNWRQSVERTAVTGFTDPCFYWDKDAGSQSSYHDITASRTSALTGTNRYAFVVEDEFSTDGASVPRAFSKIQTNGTCAFDFGGCNNFYITGSFLGDNRYSTKSRAVLITGCRLANQVLLEIFGANHTIVSCAVGPQIKVSSIDNTALQGNSYNRLPIILNSNNPRNLIDQWATAYTPVLTSGGTAPSLGNGTLAGTYSFDGSRCFFEILLSIGSTTNLGSGELFFSLPSKTSDICVCGCAWISAAGANYTAIAKAQANDNKIGLVRDTSGSITFNSPAVFAAGDFIKINGSYFTGSS